MSYYDSHQKLLYIDVALWLMLSGSVVMLQYGLFFIPLVLAFFIVQLFVTKKTVYGVRNIVVLTVFLLIYLLNFAIYSGQCTNPNQYYANILMLVCSYIFAELLPLDSVRRAFINVVTVIALFSLIMHFGGMLFHINYFTIPNTVGNIRMVGLHNYWAFIHGRNSGMYWEPGGFQIFLNMALLASAQMYTRAPSNAEWLKRLILITTVLTTQSTIGYVILGVICAIILKNVVKDTSQRSVRAVAWIIYAFVLIIMTVCIVNSPAIQNKLFIANGSTDMRMRDFQGSLALLKEIPFVGVGLNTDLKASLLASKGIYNNSVGIFASAINYGIAYMSLYICIAVKRIKSFFDGSMLVLVIMLMINLTQSVFEFPIMFMFLFNFRNDRMQGFKEIN